MPTRRKEILVSSIDTVDTGSLAPQESLITKAEAAKTVRPRRKPAQPKVTTEPAVTIKPQATIEPEATPESTETTKIAPIEIKQPTESEESSSEIVAVELEITPTEEAKEPKVPGKLNKKLRKETHTKEKFYIRNDLLDKLKVLIKINGKSFKTNLINDALEQSLKDLEATKE